MPKIVKILTGAPGHRHARKGGRFDEKVIDKWDNMVYNIDTEREVIIMKYVRFPTNLILERPQMKHLFGKWWWDKRYKQFVKGDKKVKKTIDKSGKVCYTKYNKERKR